MKKFFYLMILAFMPMVFTACSDDDGIGDGNIPSELLGTWYCNDGNLHIYFTFNEDGTGTGAADSKSTTRKYAFKYGVKNNKVTCKGAEAYAEFDGGKTTENPNWSTTFTLNGSTLTGGPYSGSSSRSTYRK